MSATGKPKDCDWVRLLEECRKEVADFTPNPYYRAAYGAEELSYWQHVPRWIYDDACERAPRRCLDVGCAYGTLLLFVKRLTGCEAFGTDFTDAYTSREMFERRGIGFAVSNVELDEPPWPPPFDMIIFTEVLEHLNFQAETTLRKLSRLLAPGGRVYLSTPDAAEWGRTTKYYRSYAELPEPREELRAKIVDDHVWQFDERELVTVLTNAGFEIVRSAYSKGNPQRHFNMTLRASR
ncbi:MAG TPA: class I SAM-dependent methyltransferase [Pyrinomonadaceae bacterium]|nr:class I SAM-dependent methyltransferase [Pyrinomonadaceae bacterium]